jgi:uncharacterized protein with PQ loop repeat
MLINALGIIGMICFAICSIPQAYKSFKDGHSQGISHAFLWLWIAGEITTLLYVVLTSCDIILLLNYIFNILFLGIIVLYKYLPRK